MQEKTREEIKTIGELNITEKIDPVEWLRNRSKELVEHWTKELGVEWSKEQIEEIAKRYADLENDFNYIKEFNKDFSYKFDKIVNILPTAEEANRLKMLIVVDKELNEEALQNVREETAREKAKEIIAYQEKRIKTLELFVSVCHRLRE